MKQWFINEYVKLCNIESSAELYQWFFRLVQICCALNLAWFLLFIMPMVAQIRAVPEFYGAGVSASWLAALWIVPAVELVVAEICLRKASTSFVAVLGGLVLAFFILFSWAFPFGILGFYCLLNKKFQQKHMKNTPMVFQEMLSALKINYIETNADLANTN